MGPKGKKKTQRKIVGELTSSEAEEKLIKNTNDRDDTNGKDKSHTKTVSQSILSQIKQLGVEAKSTDEHQFRVGRKIPCTDIPARHFLAILKKDWIQWKRNWKRSMCEIVLPMFLILIMCIIRQSIKVEASTFPSDLRRYSLVLQPMPSTEKQFGLSEDQLSSNASLGHDNWFAAMLEKYYKVLDFQKFHGFEDGRIAHSNAFATFYGDNCEETSFNKARRKWGIIGDLKNSVITKEYKKDVTNFFKIIENIGRYANQFKDVWKQSNQTEENPFRYMDGLRPYIDHEPIVFETLEQFYDHILDEEYELVDDKPGMCFAIEIRDNSWDKSKIDPDIIEAHFHVDSRDGRSPSQGVAYNGEKIYVQQNIPSTSYPAYDRYAQVPNIRASEMFVRQGVAHLQAFFANTVLQYLTQDPKAEMDISLVPMEVKHKFKDDFVQVMVSIYSYIVIAVYVLPMYSYILRMQIDKQSGIKRHLSIIGLSLNAQYLALFCSYALQCTAINTGIILMMKIGGLFQKSLSNSFILFYFFNWAQGIANFGFIVMIVNLLPHDMYPKLAAKWGSLIFFGSSFVDFTIQKHGIPEIKKTIMSFIFPTLATTRAFQNTVIHEYTPGGTGLDWDSTLFEPYHNYRVCTYFYVHFCAFFLHLSIGMLFEKYGSVPEIIKAFFRVIKGKKQLQIEEQNLMIEDSQRRGALKELNIENFQYDQNLVFGSSENYKSTDESDITEILLIQNLVKKFKQSGDEKGGKYFTAVDGLSLKMLKGEIFAMLGHNGAGKTTTISMITGMLEATSGTVKCFGKNVIGQNIDYSQQKEDLEYIRHIMGICPQHDILFDMLTVEEHLDIFCDFKGVDPALKKDKIYKIMKDVDVYVHRNTLAKDLSGGNKRKLSVALALVADSKLVLLDEPTSGMDLTARRRLWDMLKDYKKDRIVILTTHNMDEADLLGDRIGIMSAGRLVCLGTGLYLKNKYGFGYKLNLRKFIQRDDSEARSIYRENLALNFIKDNLGYDTKLIKEDSLEIELAIPKSYSSKFKVFFKLFDQQHKSLGVESYNISSTSLEEVFLKVGEEENEEAQKVENVPELDNEDVAQEISQEINNHREKQSFCQILCGQTKALTKRRLQAYSKNKIVTIFEMMVPIILIGLGFSFTKVNFLVDSPPRELSIKEYAWKQRLMLNTELVKKGEEVDDEDFDDENEDSQILKKWDKNYKANFEPIDLIKGLPGYDEGAYYIENYDAKPQTIENLKIKNKQLMKEWELKRDKMIEYIKEKQAENQTQSEIEANIQEELRKIQQMTGENLNTTFEQQETINYNETEEYKEFLQYNPKPENQPLKESDLFDHFSDQVYETRGWDPHNPDSFSKNLTRDFVENPKDVFPYRYGSYYVYEANNYTKQFKVSTLTNLTSQDVAVMFPQFMYESIIKLATGKKDLKFKVVNQPFPITKRTLDGQELASGIFVCFVTGIGLSLIPASIATRVVHERENGLYHMQIVSGVNKLAYWVSFFILDLIMAYVPCILTCVLIELFELKYQYVWLVLLVYPWAVVPFTYCTSQMFSKESTAQAFTIYLHFAMSGIGGMIVFALRMVEGTALWGDRMMWIMRYLNPSFNVCNAIIFSSSSDILNTQRQENRRDIQNKYPARPDLLPKEYFPSLPFYKENLGGDLFALVVLIFVWIFIFYQINTVNWAKVEEKLAQTFIGKCCIKKLPEPLDDEKLDLDEDVRQEQDRVADEQKSKGSYVRVNKFRKVYRVPFSDPILAVERASFAVDRGECFALLGVNGAGKSTTFKSLTNVVTPTKGEVQIHGLSTSDDFNKIRHMIGYCPQHHAIFDSVTVLEHLKFYAVLKGIPEELQEKLIQGVIKKLGIQQYENRSAEKLSGGNKRKLQVAISILGNPQIIFLDEPSAGMDPGSRRFMWRVVGSITGERKKSCVILTTHSMEEAEALSTKMGILVRGGVFTCFGTAQHIKDKFGTAFEIEVKLNCLSKDEIDEKLEMLEILNHDSISIQEFSKKAISMKILPAEMQSDFEIAVLKIIYNLNSEGHQVDELVLSPEIFISCLNSYLCQIEIIKQLLQQFGKAEILESYGDQYFKIRVPKSDKSIGFIFGFIEGIKSSKLLSIQEYSISQTTLEMIFNYFAKGGKGGQNIDREMSEANGGCTNQATYQLINNHIRCQRFSKGGVKTCSLAIKDKAFENFKSQRQIYSIN